MDPNQRTAEPTQEENKIAPDAGSVELDEQEADGIAGGLIALLRQGN